MVIGDDIKDIINMYFGRGKAEGREFFEWDICYFDDISEDFIEQEISEIFFDVNNEDFVVDQLSDNLVKQSFFYDLELIIQIVFVGFMWDRSLQNQTIFFILKRVLRMVIFASCIIRMFVI